MIKIPNGQKLWLTYTIGENKYHITSNKDRSKYYSYFENNGKLEPMKTSTIPTKLEKDFK